MSEQRMYTVDEHVDAVRIDAFLASQRDIELSRSKIKKLILAGTVRVNNETVPAHYRIKSGDVITVQYEEVSEPDVVAEDIPLDILYEDDDLIVLNKPAGLVVHPGAGNATHTLVNALKYHADSVSTRGGIVRAGIVHRLDKDTSGLMVIAKNDWTHERLSRQFKDRSVHKVYTVLVKGVVQHDAGKCDVAIGRGRVFRTKQIVRPVDGKEAFTEFRVLQRFQKASLLEVKIHTGRTHQIRVHMAHLGFPVFGDRVYGYASPLINRQCLHASFLEFYHPRAKKRMQFSAPLPDDMQQIIESFK